MAKVAKPLKHVHISVFFGVIPLCELFSVHRIGFDFNFRTHKYANIQKRENGASKMCPDLFKSHSDSILSVGVHRKEGNLGNNKATY